MRGSWHAAGAHAPILTGGLIKPGSLLLAGEGSSEHSLTILLPDGQRVLYECFAPEDCARGFRIPRLYRQPEPLAAEMITAIHASLQRPNSDTHASPADSRIPQDEAIAILDPQNQIEVAGLATKLPNGAYTYSLRPLNRAESPQSGVALEKKTSSIKLKLPSPGLFQVTIADQLNTPRISLFVAAVKPGQDENYIARFHKAQALLQDWNGDYQGWPIHEFQRAYLESLLLSLHASPQATEASPEVVESAASSATAEPAFSPRPGAFEKDLAVTLRCNTAGATIHYTVDGSQPFKTSPVYHAPIIVKGTALTIKAYATSDGKQDSAVVTGIFRIEEH